MRTLYRFIAEHDIIFIGMLVGLIALILRLVNLEIWPRWYTDEAIYAQEGLNMIQGTWGSEVLGVLFRPPLLPLLSGLLQILFGSSYFIVRLPGAVFGSISCVLLLFIGTKLYNRFIGISAALVLMIASVAMNRILLLDNGVELFFLLAIFLYLKGREDEKRRWFYLAGISAGLAFLAKYSGIAALLFLIVQAAVDKRFRGIWKISLAFSLMALILPVIGRIIDWNIFVRDTLEYGSRLVRFDNLLDTLVRSHYASQISSPLYFNIWSTGGFILLFYLLARNTSSDKTCCIWAGAIFLTSVVYGSAWWAFLVVLYPVYGLAIATSIYDIVHRRGDYWLLTVFTFFLMLPVFTQQKWYPVLPPAWGRMLLLFVSFIIFLILLVRRYQIKRDQISEPAGGNSLLILHSIMLAPLLVIIVMLSSFELKPLFFENEVRDQQAVVNWINANTSKEDIIAAAAPIVFYIEKSRGIRYEYVTLYTTREGFLDLKQDLLPRFKRDYSLAKMDYFVTDTPLVYTGTGEAPGGPGLEIYTEVLKHWNIVFQTGDYWVFRNPASNPITPPVTLSLVPPSSSSPTPSFFTTSGIPEKAAPGSVVSTSANSANLTLASTTDGVTVTVWVRSQKAYPVPLDITVKHTIPALDTAGMHAYNFALITEDGNTFFIVHYLNNPSPYIEVGMLKAGEWTPLWGEARQPPSDPIEWRIILDSSTFTLYENGEQLYQGSNGLPQTSFYLQFSHDTSDTTLKTWVINDIKVNGEKIQ